MQKNTINGFSYYSVDPMNQNESNKVILIYHGWGGSALGYRDLAAELAGEGFHVIIPEIVHHDTRQPLANHFDQETVQTYFWETIMATIDEFPDFMATLGMTKENVILLGSSMGGCIANGIFAREPMAGGLININGSGSFVLSEKLFRERDQREQTPDELKNRLMKYDPVARESGFSPVLLMHGDSDDIMPIDGQRDYARYVRANSRNVDFRVYKGVNHQITQDMIGDLVRWVDRLSK
ncbi:alpha/beta fold hydrolase [Rossellomorea sp. NPDC077527]|uniref:alpha/beta fold hydrolase n=1 Tax=Rossellomorea sp. NPDC077527 TaxID=3364510 RepID=UPI0037CC1C27